MFNLFKKSDSRSIEQQIHDDVYFAEGLILAEAKRILANPPKFTSEQKKRLEELTKLGFANFDEAKQLKIEEEKFQKHNTLNNFIEHYSFVYPLNRFISQDAVQEIIAKYKLVLAHSSDYIAEIPEKNQKEIIQFRVKRRDVREPEEMRRGWGFMPLIFPNFGSLAYQQRHTSLAEMKMLATFKNMELNEYIHWREEENNKREQEAFEKEQKRLDEKIPGEDLLIIAPQHKLDMRGKEVRKGILMIKDPIVLQPVNGGYLIVTSWGLEASDPLVVNKISN